MRARPLVFSAAVGLCLSACGGTAAATSRTASRSSPTTSATPPRSTVTTYGGFVGAAATQACLEDARQAQQASDFYAGEHGSPAPSLAALVQAGILRQAPATGHGYVIAYDPSTGKVTASGACTVGG
ncbi:MAG TPA: hypothetical protein VFA11_05815 [Acidimicrobiales bacterium]|nr:hypothetical protein [Acidimicrobiales bacterium]